MPTDAVNASAESTTVGAVDFEDVFRTEYSRIIRTIDRVIRDASRSEDLAVEAFWRLWRSPQAHNASAGAWVYRTAVRLALDELRRRARRARYEAMLGHLGVSRTPDELFSVAEQQGRVRAVLAALARRDAEMLLLQSDDHSYADVAAALDLNAASVGTLLSRAKQAFRKEYVRRYGEP